MSKPDNHSQPSYLLPFAGIISLVVITLVILHFTESRNKPVIDFTNSQQLSWTQVSDLNIPRRALTAVVANGFIYVIGGVDAKGDYVRKVEYAEILADASLSEWRFTSELNQGRFYLASAVIKNTIYAIGGGAGALGDNNQPSAIVEKASLSADGRLSSWQFVTEMTTPRRGLKVLTYGNTLYALGGYNGVFLKTIERATVNLFGEIDTWVLEKHESIIDRYIHSAAIDKKSVYLLGGHVRGQNKMSYSDVERASIQPDKSLSAWKVENTKLRLPRFIASAIAMNKYIYLLAGHNGGVRLADVEFSSINSSGKLGSWQPTAKLSHKRSAAAVVKYNNAIYVIGGMGDNGPLNKVEMAKQMQNGHLGVLP